MAQARVGAGDQARVDPPRPPAADGWAPDEIRPIRSRLDGGFLGSAVGFALGGVDEAPGQRLSTAQVDALAPYYAKTFDLDEQFVRSELAKVYLYVGGPSANGNAMTIGHHVYMPDAASLKSILGPNGKRWLSHELTHTMQFAAYDGGSPHRFLASYLTGFAVGRDPSQPGSGDGRSVWGALFTGLSVAGEREDQLGSESQGVGDRMLSTVVPAATLSVPVGLFAGGTLALSRVTTGRALLGTGGSVAAGLGTIALPAIAGASIGAAAGTIGSGTSEALGAVAGGVLGASALAAGGALRTRSPLMLAAVGAGVAGASLIGWMSARTSAATTTGWSRSASVITDDGRQVRDRKLDYQHALHDSHWLELDAEATARRFTRGGVGAAGSDTGEQTSTAGRTPDEDSNLADRVGDRIDWGVKLPLLLGLPAAGAIGTGVLAARTGTKVVSETIKEARTPMQAVGIALRQLGAARSGIGNSMAIGASLTVAPLLAGGLLGPLVADATGSNAAGGVGGGVAGAALGGGLLATRVLGRGSGPSRAAWIIGGSLVAGAMGVVAGSAASAARHPHERRYVSA